MRVISGEKRGMILFSPADSAVRPTTDKIKGAVFNSIQNRLRDATVFVDLFGGSGAMGIEALSRGVDEAWFFDTAKNSIALIRKNLDKAGYLDRAHVCHTSAESGLDRMVSSGTAGDIFFLDPPYILGKQIPALMEKIFLKKALKKNGIIVIECDKNVIIPERILGLSCVRKKEYGITCIRTYEGSQ